MRTITIFILLFIISNLASAQNTILWSVRKPNSENTSYILGTFHQMGNSFIDDKPLIKKLLFEADLAIFESIEDRTEKIIQVMLSRVPDSSYKEHLYQEDVDFLENYAKDWKIPLSQQKPGELIVKLQQEYTKAYCGTIKETDTSIHMDEYLISLAQAKQLKTAGLESDSIQFDAINRFHGEELTWGKTKEAIHQLVTDLQDDKNKKQNCAFARQYLQMKFDYQFNLKCAENNQLLTKRNENWMPQIKSFIQKNRTVFIAVGMLHLYGECGIISQLRKDGYEVNPIKL